MPPERRTRAQRIRRWIIGIALALLLLGTVTSWLVFQHIPRWYQPVHVGVGDVKLVQADLTATSQNFFDQVNGDTIFEFAITDAQLNAWLAVRDTLPVAREWIPPAMEDPFIAFESDRVVLAATARFGSVRTVLSVVAHLAIDGHDLVVRLSDVKGGSLPVPDAVLARLLRDLDTAEGRRSSGLPSAVDLLTGARFPAEFEWANPKRRIRLHDMRIEPGAIHLRIEPLERPHERSR